MNRIKPDDMVACYKLILADEWHELSERDRRQYIRRMIMAKHGAFSDEEMFPVIQKTMNTDIYKWGEAEGVLDEPKPLSSSSSYESNDGRMSYLRRLRRRLPW